MEPRTITGEQIENFSGHLDIEERAQGTVEKYLRDIRTFALWLDGRAVSKELVSEWKEVLQQRGKTAATVNGALAALHSFFAFLGWQDCRVRYLKVQHQVFRDASRELTREEYVHLVEAAKDRKNNRLALILETICATGIRVSEIRYITLEAARQGRADISLKGKIRTILLPGKLSRKLIKYAQNQKIASGGIFLTGSGKDLSRRQIWAEMKRLCKAAGVEESKVFPHNLRHLFARAFYKAYRDIAKLADVLGHSSIETTRIYLISTGAEHVKQMEKLGLIS